MNVFDECSCKGSFTIVNIYVLVQRVLGGGEGGPRPAYYFLNVDQFV